MATLRSVWVYPCLKLENVWYAILCVQSVLIVSCIAPLATVFALARHVLYTSNGLKFDGCDPEVNHVFLSTYAAVILSS